MLREAKLTLQKTATEQRELAEQLQEDLNLANQRLKLSKQTVQVGEILSATYVYYSIEKVFSHK